MDHGRLASCSRNHDPFARRQRGGTPASTSTMPTASIESILTCPTLPSLPMVAMEVLELTGDVNVDLNRIAACVQNDQALTGKILRTINSSYYGLSEPCPTISRAIAYLGLNTVKSLVLSFSLVDTIGSSEPEMFDFQQFWRRSLYGAAGARAFAEAAGSCDPEEAFTAALLQDIGMIAAVTAMKHEYNAVVNAVGHDQLCAREQQAFGFDHTQIGEALAQKWRLPEQLTITIRHHHTPEKVTGAHATIVRTAALGYHAAELLTADNGTHHLEAVKTLGRTWFSFPDAVIQKQLERIGNDAAALARLFNLDTGEHVDTSRILGRATEALVEHQLRVNHEAAQLRESNEELSKQNTVDALTGAFNRRHFDAQIDMLLAEAQERGGSLALAFIDADYFKSINDTHGHLAGDAVLIELVQRLRETVGDRGVVYRFGGEEFTVLLPGVDRAAAAPIAESLRMAVQAQPFDVGEVDCDADQLDVTISIGLAAFESDVADRLTDAARLIDAADKAAYAAKQAGRNCVRIYAPRRVTTGGVLPAEPAAAA